MKLRVKQAVDRTCGGCHLCERTSETVIDDDIIYAPSHLVFEITNQCNLDCIMCERKLVQPDDLMNFNTFQDGMNGLSPGVIAIELSGLGEPTLAPLFPLMAQRVYDAQKVLYVPTNGAAITKDIVLSSLRDSDNTRISVSIDAATEESYGKIRVDKRGRPNDWSTLWRNIASFRAARPNARLSTCFTAGAYNIDEFPQFVSRAIEYGFNEISMKSVRCWGISPEKNSLRFQKDRTQRAVHAAQEIAYRESIRLNVEQITFSEAFANSGQREGFISYLDIIPLGVFECGGSSVDSTTGSISTTGTDSVTLSSLMGPDIIERLGIFRSPKRVDGNPVDVAPTPTPTPKIVHTRDVVVVLSDGTICTCGAKHPIGHVSKDTFESIVGHYEYQLHLRARALGQAEKSKWCRGCEKMF